MSKKIKLLVEVDESTYNSAKNMPEIICGMNDDLKFVSDLKDAIANGTPITEGDLISRSELREKIHKEGEQWKANTEYECGRFDSCDMIDFLVANAPSIGGNQNE